MYFALGLAHLRWDDMPSITGSTDGGASWFALNVLDAPGWHRNRGASTLALALGVAGILLVKE